MDEFKSFRVLIVDPAGYSKNLLRSILTTLGVARIETLTSTDEALGLLRLEFFHILFCDENAGPMRPVPFVRALRCDLETVNVILPIVLVSAGTNHGSVAAWRDMGGNDVIVKPVSLETVKNRLQALILAPKPFVTAKAFIGPDRRHSRDERRQFGERRPLGEDRRKQSTGAKIFSAPVWAKPEDPVSDT